MIRIIPKLKISAQIDSSDRSIRCVAYQRIIAGEAKAKPIAEQKRIESEIKRRLHSLDYDDREHDLLEKARDVIYNL